MWVRSLRWNLMDNRGNGPRSPGNWAFCPTSYPLPLLMRFVALGTGSAASSEVVGADGSSYKQWRQKTSRQSACSIHKGIAPRVPWGTWATARPAWCLPAYCTLCRLVLLLQHIDPKWKMLIGNSKCNMILLCTEWGTPIVWQEAYIRFQNLFRFREKLNTTLFFRDGIRLKSGIVSSKLFLDVYYTSRSVCASKSYEAYRAARN